MHTIRQRTIVSAHQSRTRAREQYVRNTLKALVYPWQGRESSASVYIPACL